MGPDAANTAAYVDPSQPTTSFDVLSTLSVTPAVGDFVVINNQNGSIVDAVRLWKRNVDKTFEGVEECSICYAVVHDSNYQLPKTVRPPCPFESRHRALRILLSC